MEKIELEIIDLDDNARGIAKKDNLIYFVEDAIYGEVLEAEIKDTKKNFVIAKKIKTIAKSPYLEENMFAKNNLCGIYDLVDLKYEEQVKLKKNQIINTINRVARENLSDINFVQAKNRISYRNKVELKLTPDGELAFFMRNSNDYTLAENCIMNTIEIQRAVKSLANLLRKLKISGYDPNSNEGVVKNIILRSSTLGETMGILIFNEEFDFKPFYEELKNENIFTSFYVSRNTKPRNYKIANLHKVFGEDKIREKLGEYEFLISPNAFMQVNTEISYQIYLLAKEYIQKLNPDLIIDLYSGISTTSILLSDTSDRIVSVELNKDAVNDATENARINKIKNIEFINDYAEKAIDRIELNYPNSVCLFDPPRRGLDINIINKVGDSNINHIVYISCNPATLARDILRFKEYRFNLKDLTGFDQFVNTIETECLAVLTRENI